MQSLEIVVVGQFHQPAELRFYRAEGCGIQRLFREEKDLLRLMKYRLTYRDLELATDKCEDVANVIESIMLKYA